MISFGSDVKTKRKHSHPEPEIREGLEEIDTKLVELEFHEGGTSVKLHQYMEEYAKDKKADVCLAFIAGNAAYNAKGKLYTWLPEERCAEHGK